MACAGARAGVAEGGLEAPRVPARLVLLPARRSKVQERLAAVSERGGLFPICLLSVFSQNIPSLD